jgi:hypothetical protein
MTDQLIVIHAAGKSYAVPKAVGETYNELEDALLSALPFVEDAENDPAFKPGVIKRHLTKIRAVLKQSGAIKYSDGANQ